MKAYYAKREDFTVCVSYYYNYVQYNTHSNFDYAHPLMSDGSLKEHPYHWMDNISLVIHY